MRDPIVGEGLILRAWTRADVAAMVGLFDDLDNVASVAVALAAGCRLSDAPRRPVEDKGRDFVVGVWIHTDP